ncbi:DNA-directed RNA polymerase II subunit RPB1-like [Danaus plexippus]|uniref:DNA-directed RNA polymerase II subunit RPB1-like n=1 Tax=Danaus plexippus TaxID=13037 RepID=UPI002AB272C8|nr:DNA-directed RNA polymerase II subunit RPB1-like [Danaus plexippus]
MPTAADLGISEKEYQDAINLEKIYDLIQNNDITCSKCRLVSENAFKQGFNKSFDQQDQINTNSFENAGFAQQEHPNFGHIPKAPKYSPPGYGKNFPSSYSQPSPLYNSLNTPKYPPQTAKCMPYSQPVNYPQTDYYSQFENPSYINNSSYYKNPPYAENNLNADNSLYPDNPSYPYNPTYLENSSYPEDRYSKSMYDNSSFGRSYRPQAKYEQPNGNNLNNMSSAYAQYTKVPQYMEPYNKSYPNSKSFMFEQAPHPMYASSNKNMYNNPPFFNYPNTNNIYNAPKNPGHSTVREPQPFDQHRRSRSLTPGRSPELQQRYLSDRLQDRFYSTSDIRMKYPSSVPNIYLTNNHQDNSYRYMSKNPFLNAKNMIYSDPQSLPTTRGQQPFVQTYVLNQN